MEALQAVVDGQVAENLGMAMIYAVVAAAQEWLRDKVHTRHTLPGTPIRWQTPGCSARCISALGALRFTAIETTLDASDARQEYYPTVAMGLLNDG